MHVGQGTQNFSSTRSSAVFSVILLLVAHSDEGDIMTAPQRRQRLTADEIRHVGDQTKDQWP